MKRSNIYIGNIMLIENGKNELYQSTNLLLSLGNGNYVNLDWIVSLKDHLKFYRLLLTGNYDEDIVISDKENEEGIYVDSESLILYYDRNDNKGISIGKLKQDVLLDAKVPKGLDYQLDGNILLYVGKPNPKK